MNPLYADMPTSIFEEMSLLARRHDAINLGQGFPDDSGPTDVRQAAADAVLHGSNQYPPMMGLDVLRHAAAEHYRRFQGLDIGAPNILVTSGATEALAAALIALITPGDQVIVIQPAYDAYVPLILRAGGVPRFVSVAPPDWRLPIADIAAAIGPDTRLIMFNDPMNPVARVFDAGEVDALADLCVRHDLIAICDEVWEHVLFDGRTHQPLIARPGMAARAVKIGSAGKIFSLTGWKVGLVVADSALLGPIARAHQFLTFATPPNLQVAVAYGLGKDDAYFRQMRAGYQRGRDRLAALLTDAGYAVLPSEGTYFLCVDLAASGIAQDDRSVCRDLVAAAGVAAIPLSAFHVTPPDDHVIRLCFAKQDAVIDAAGARLAAYRRTLAD
ncbi:aminotransferase [Sphingomonas sp. Leaf357]|uniref:aminotransferase n=1 Tax=Sphingomonas sp. Leaf357 TaxID=1736350 RepID=UPI0006F32C87|nr:aminotransferase [Sphingomonas sp. Leaf357]KQS02993.1 aminotransferase [Sphingomonas sp. Leaf357]